MVVADLAYYSSYRDERTLQISAMGSMVFADAM